MTKKHKIMIKDKSKKYTVSRKKPLMTQPADVYYDGININKNEKENVIYDNQELASRSLLNF